MCMDTAGCGHCYFQYQFNVNNDESFFVILVQNSAWDLLQHIRLTVSQWDIHPHGDITQASDMDQ